MKKSGRKFVAVSIVQFPFRLLPSFIVVVDDGDDKKRRKVCLKRAQTNETQKVFHFINMFRSILSIFPFFLCAGIIKEKNISMIYVYTFAFGFIWCVQRRNALSADVFLARIFVENLFIFFGSVWSIRHSNQQSVMLTYVFHIDSNDDFADFICV